MTYGLDLRERVVAHVLSGGSKAEASRFFKVSLWCVNDWISRKDISPRVYPRRSGKIDMQKLSQHIQNNNDAILREIAVEFSVTEQAIWYALRRLKITHKKNNAL